MQKRVLSSTIMVLAILLVSIFSTSTVSANGMDWHSYEEGLSVSEQREQPVMIYFYTENCGACVMMEEQTFTERKVQERGDDTVFVKVDASAEGELASQYGITGVPTTVFIDSNEDTIREEVGFMDADHLTTVIDDVISDGEVDDDQDTSNQETDDQEQSFLEDNFLRNMLIITVSSLVVAIAIILSLNKMKEEDN